jgi:hypothetical protein
MDIVLIGMALTWASALALTLVGVVILILERITVR